MASRRGADKLIEEGRVKVNGKVVKELGSIINEKNDTVMVDDKIVKPTSDFAYVLFYKPKGCITTVSDEKGRKTIYDYLGDLNIPHLIPVGRLDYDTEGKNRQIRKMFEAVDREVKFLKRIAVGELRLGGLPRGGYRYLNEDEVFYLKNM